MKKRQRRIAGIFIIAVVATISSGIYAVEAETYTSSIPPTAAFQSIEVQTDPWSAFGNYTVTADTSYQQIHFVSDGSIIFNVTETYP